MNFLEGIGSTIGGITAVATGGFTLYKLFIKKWILKRVAQKKAEQETLFTKFHDAMMIPIKEIKDKIFPNGGGSLDDKMEDIKSTLIKLLAGQRNTWELMDVAVWISNEEGRTIYVNKPYCELVGCAYTDALGMSWLGLISSADRANVREGWKESVENVSDFDMCYSVHRSDGLYQKVNAVAVHNRDQNGKLIGSMGRLIKIDEPYKL